MKIFKNYLVIGLIFLLVSSSTLVNNVRSQPIIDNINEVEKNDIIVSVISNVLQKLKDYDNDYLEKQISKMESFLKTRFCKVLLNNLNLNKILDENLEVIRKYLFTDNNYKNYNKEPAKNTVTLRTCTLNGIEEIKKEMTDEEVTKLSFLLNDMKESLKIIESNKASSYEKKEAYRTVDNVYYHLKEKGLFPSNIGKEEAIDLITGKYGKKIYENLGWAKISNFLFNKELQTVSDEEIRNIYCNVSCNGYAHITYLAIDPWLLILGSLPRLIITSPLLILLVLLLPLLPVIVIIYMIAIILDEQGYELEVIFEIIDKYTNIFISLLGLSIWALEPGFKLMYLHHKLIPERRLVGYASLTDGNLSVTTKGVYGSQSGIVSDLEITGFIGLWIESNIQEPVFPDLNFSSTLSCHGFALSVNTPRPTKE